MKKASLKSFPGHNKLKKIIILIFLFVFILETLVYSHWAYSLKGAETNIEDPSPEYFYSMLYDTGRLVSLNLNTSQKADLAEINSSLFSNRNTTCLVLMYHNFYTSGPRKGGYYVRIDNFQKQLEILQELSFKPITLEDLYYFFKFNKKIPERSVILTFDDGFKSFNLVYPLIKQYKFKCVLSLITGYIGSVWTLSKDDLLRFKKEGFVEFASHTSKLHNKFKENLEKKNYNNIKWDLEKSKEFFQKELGYKVIAFTYPWGYGSTDKELRKILEDKGFLIGFDIWRRKVNVAHDDPLSVSRIDISETNLNDNPGKFREIIESLIKK
jgi:peptidoglycan/xylan/chitin deacetylase (PgdA/CDA1 family)